MNKIKKYALFCNEPKVDESCFTVSWTRIFGGDEQDGEEWKKDKKEAQKKDMVLRFVCFCSTPKEVIRAVQKDPTKKYILMSGHIEDVHVATPVFVGGKNLATLDKEWGE